MNEQRGSITPDIHPDSDKPGAMGTVNPEKYGPRTGPGIICNCDLHLKTGATEWFCDYHERQRGPQSQETDDDLVK